MDRVLVCGYCGGINVGDEAIIATLANFLSEKFDYRVAILSGDPAASRHYIGEQFEYVQSFYPRKAGAHPSLLALVPAVKSCKAVFFAGGGLIQDVHSTSLLEHITLIAELAHSLGIPVFSLGIGAGPIRTEKGKALGKRFLFANSSIYLRDEYSASYLRALYENFDYEYFKVQNDTITLLGQRERDSNNNKLIGICFRDWSGFEREWLLSICEKLAADGCKLIFMAYESVDMEIYCFLRDRLGEAIVISDESTLENSLNTIAKLDALLSMRLHANIFAMLYSVPFVALSYDEKLRSVLGRFGFGDRVLSLGCDENQVLDLLKQKTTLSTDKLSKLQSDQAAAVYGLVGDLDLHAGSGSIIKHIRVFYSWWCDIYAQPVIRKFSLRFFSKFSSFLPNSMKRNLKRRLGIKW